jgi:hypothetical protein
MQFQLLSLTLGNAIQQPQGPNIPGQTQWRKQASPQLIPKTILI